MNGLPVGPLPAHFLREDGRRSATATERRILSLLRDEGPLSRSDLARRSDLSAQSLMRIADALLARQLISEGKPVSSGPGKPATPLSIVADAAFGIGFSVMTDTLSLAILDLAGTIRFTGSAPLEDKAIQPAVLQMRAMMHSALAETRISEDRIVGAGVGVTGYFIDATARVNPPSLLEPWALIPLDTILSEGLGIPVRVDNDGNVAAIGEEMLGAGREAGRFAYLYFSAGFGGGVILDGHHYRGRFGNAGEFASLIPPGWPQPNLERLRLAVNAAGGTFSDLHGLLADFDPSLPGVAEWVEEIVPSLDLVISGISGILDPDAIIFGGRMPRKLAERILPRLSLFNEPRRGKPRPAPLLDISRIEHDAAALGAASMPLRAAFFEQE